jgi:F-type H+-transporting ATPase subunit b
MLDWLTVTAQIVNFLILLALLNRFLYRPILANMEARKQYIAQRLDEAGQIQAKAERLIATYREKLAALEEERARVLAEAQQEAQSQREALLEQARREVEEKRQRWRQDWLKEQEALVAELKAVVAEQAVELARKALKELAGQELEERLIETFLKQLPAQLLAQSAKEWTVITGFPLDSSCALRLREELARLRPDIRLNFKHSDELICGIALETDGQVWRWNLAAYLAEVEARLRQELA